MTRKEKRELRKDKSLVCGLYNIIDKYSPKIFIIFKGLTDKNNKKKLLMI